LLYRLNLHAIHEGRIATVFSSGGRGGETWIDCPPKNCTNVLTSKGIGGEKKGSILSSCRTSLAHSIRRIGEREGGRGGKRPLRSLSPTTARWQKGRGSEGKRWAPDTRVDSPYAFFGRKKEGKKKGTGQGSAALLISKGGINSARKRCPSMAEQGKEGKGGRNKSRPSLIRDKLGEAS